MKKSRLRIIRVSLILFLALMTIITVTHAKETTQTKTDKSQKEDEKKSGLLKGYFKSKDIQVFPIPVYDRRPDRGNTYGLMPVLVVSDKGENAISAIYGLIGKYNSITKYGGALLAHFFPKEGQEINFYGEWNQKYGRELELRFSDPRLTNKFYLETYFQYIKSPFGRFFGLGPKRDKDDQSTYTSREFKGYVTAGYYLLKDFRINWTPSFTTVDILNRANEDIIDTQVRYGALGNVTDSTNFKNKFSLTFDSRKNGAYSERGHLVDLGYKFSHKGLGSDKTFHGFEFEYINIFPLIKDDRLTQVFRFQFQRYFGDAIPFYEMANMGGDDNFRSFTPLRFTDNGKIAFQIEERIKLFDMTLFGKSFSGHLDPFIEVGRVFDQVSHLGLNDWTLVSGIGLRLKVPPNIIGRLDVAYGSDGLEIYTELGYPF